MGNRGGRPKAPEPSTKLSTWVSTRQYDQLVKLSKQREQSLSGLVRDLLTLKLQPPAGR